MIFILISWLLALVTIVMLLRALHTIPTHTHTPLESDSQKLQLQNLLRMAKLLLSVSLGLLALHFTLPNEIEQKALSNAHVGVNASIRIHTLFA